MAITDDDFWAFAIIGEYLLWSWSGVVTLREGISLRTIGLDSSDL